MACELDFAAMMAEERANRKRQSTKSKPRPAVSFVQQSLSGAGLLPDTVVIIDDFVTEQQAATLIDGARSGKWVTMPNRRVQNLGGTPHPDGMIEQPLPTYMQPLCDALLSANLFKQSPNHCLLNEYSRGGGIAAHRDGPRYEPVAAILSLESSAVLKFHSTLGGEVASVLLRPRSLLCFSQEAYTDLLHGIDAVECDEIGERCCNSAAGEVVERGTRLSITLRRAMCCSEVLHTQEMRDEISRREAQWLKAICDE